MEITTINKMNVASILPKKDGRYYYRIITFSTAHEEILLRVKAKEGKPLLYYTLETPIYFAGVFGWNGSGLNLGNDAELQSHLTTVYSNYNEAQLQACLKKYILLKSEIVDTFEVKFIISAIQKHEQMPLRYREYIDLSVWDASSSTQQF